MVIEAMTDARHELEESVAIGYAAKCQYDITSQELLRICTYTFANLRCRMGEKSMQLEYTRVARRRVKSVLLQLLNVGVFLLCTSAPHTASAEEAILFRPDFFLNIDCT